MAVPTVTLFFMAGGWIGMASLAVIWGISTELEALNYLEHYGLIVLKINQSIIATTGITLLALLHGSSLKSAVKQIIVVEKLISGSLKMLVALTLDGATS